MGVGRKVASLVGWFERRALVALAVVLFALALARGDFDGWRWPAPATTVLLALLLAHRLFLIYRVRGRFARPAGSDPEASAEYLQLELLLVCAVYLLLHLTGGPQSPLYPLMWALMAAVGGLDPARRNLAVVILAAAGLEILPAVGPAVLDGAGLETIWTLAGWRTLVHLSALTFFPYLARVLVSALAQHLRLVAGRDARERQVQFDQERRQRELDARQYRLGGGVAGIKSKKRSAEKRKHSSLSSLKRRVHSLLVILQESLRPNTIAFFLLSRDGRTVKLMDSISATRDELIDESLPAGKGVIGAILKNLDTVSFNHLRWDPDRFNYYDGKVGLKTFMGVPILDEDDDGQLVPRGVLLADRAAEVAFGHDDEQLLKVSALELLRSMDTERVIGETEELGGLLEASEQLNRAVNLAEVVDEVLIQVRNLCLGIDLAAIALKDDGRTWLSGVQADEGFAAWKEEHVQREIDPDSLCCQCIQTCSVLPSIPFHKRSREQRQVFGGSPRLDGLQSLKCLPLKVAGTEGRKSQPGEERAIGALVISSRKKGLFPDDPDELAGMIGLLEILANMSAISIQNAQRWEQLERLATTDGLTCLHNHRRFKEMLDEEVAASLRYGRQLSMILSDIDHFKQVNDTYGHSMGDEVLKRVARVLSDLAREADKVCRYGGEEFSVILPETDAEGARMLAERFREEIGEQTFIFEGKRFGVTLSLGICTLPEHARRIQELIDRADQALYHAKRSGRDRSVHFADIAGKAAPGA